MTNAAPKIAKRASIPCMLMWSGFMVPFPPTTAVWVDALATSVFVPSETTASTDDSGTMYGGILIDSEPEAHDVRIWVCKSQYVVLTVSYFQSEDSLSIQRRSVHPLLSPRFVVIVSICKK